ncbi:hypothetical protein ACFQZX_04740 [Mucilaginibacter litoreus]|uniref:PXPV repeat-containing protein n=1 Tax=Mucilaginibacter litoreus TaxID=1048221 RepID=A0ABW3APF6_9SPHI
MKTLKIFAIAIIAMFGFNSAKAQVAVSAHIGTPAVHASAVYVKPAYRPAPRRVVMVDRSYRRRYYRRPVVVTRPVYYRHHPKRVVVVRHY